MRSTMLSLLLSLLTTGALLAAEHPAGAEAKPLSVLFIGNSYTAFNDLPRLVAALAQAAGGREIETGRSIHGGFTFEQHFGEKETLKKIASRHWDVVVLQEQSMRPVVDPKKMHEFARRLHAEIEKQGAETVFFLTWARQHKPRMQAGLNEAYCGIAKQLAATVAPVGVAWKNAMAADPELVLHNKDGSHPNPSGSYLAACVFYATLLKKTPEGLPGEIRSGQRTLIKLDPEQARRLQTIAWKVSKPR